MNKVWSIIDLFRPVGRKTTGIAVDFRERIFIVANLLLMLMTSYMVLNALILQSAYKVYALSFFFIQSAVALGVLKKIGRVERVIFALATMVVLECGVMIYLDQTVITTYFYWLSFACLVVTFVGGKVYGALITVFIIIEVYLLNFILIPKGVTFRTGLDYSSFVQVQMTNVIFLIIFTYAICLIIDFTRTQLQEKLLLSQRRVLENSKTHMMNNLFGGLSHEINNPLCAIRFANDLIRMRLEQLNIEDAKISKMIGKIDNSIDKASEVVTSLKNIIPDDANSDQNYNYITFSTLEKDLENLFVNEMISHSIKFSIENNISDNNKLFCDKKKILEAIIHLVQNSIYSVDRSKEKWIKIVFDNDVTYKIKVIDSGPGIQEEIIEKIFNPFFTSKDVNEGMGLGLNFAESIAKSHSGEIHYSTDGGYTCFTISILRI